MTVNFLWPLVNYFYVFGELWLHYSHGILRLHASLFHPGVPSAGSGKWLSALNYHDTNTIYQRPDSLSSLINKLVGVHAYLQTALQKIWIHADFLYLYHVGAGAREQCSTDGSSHTFKYSSSWISPRGTLNTQFLSNYANLILRNKNSLQHRFLNRNKCVDKIG